MSELPTFGFKATYTPAYYDGDDEGWKVTLPHQCDSWCITADSDYGSPVSKDEALTRLRQFIAEAQAVMAQIGSADERPSQEISFGRSDA